LTDFTTVSVTSSAELAVKKLQKAEIGIYNCKKEGANFIFSVKDKHIKKVFAIFAKPCYNICVYGESRKTALFKRAVARAGLIVGAAAFVAVAWLSESFVFKINVEGSGSYLSPEVKRIIHSSGAKEFSLCSGFDAPAATGKILALPRVTFCNIQKRGSILHVDVQVDEEHSGGVSRTPLVSDVDGVIKYVAAICGTAVVGVGDSVKKGDEIIAAYTLVGEQRTDCLAVGYAEVEYTGRAEYPADCESDENLKNAYSSVLIGADKIISRSHTVTPTDGGVVYVIDFTCLHKLSINME